MIENDGADTIVSGVIRIGNQEFPVTRLEPGSRQGIVFQPREDAGYIVQLAMSSSRAVVDTIGYVTGGIVFSDTVGVRDSVIELRNHGGTHPPRTPGVASNPK